MANCRDFEAFSENLIIKHDITQDLKLTKIRTRFLVSKYLGSWENVVNLSGIKATPGDLAAHFELAALPHRV
jgi:hypothetical protein